MNRKGVLLADAHRRCSAGDDAYILKSVIAGAVPRSQGSMPSRSALQ